MKTELVLPLSNNSVDHETVGGKGLSLAKMIHAGLPVPDGFLTTTTAYRVFVEVNQLEPRIRAALEATDSAVPASLETASTVIDSWFSQGEIPAGLSAAIRAAYRTLSAPAGGRGISVAVRSSATAEDLPGASFAGQQATFLNVCGEEDLLDAVRRCWASLWTTRAIAYRLRNNIDQNEVAMAVVVQELVPAEAAGILFTANPVSGSRDEMVINASWGLGEAIVGGLVTPDTIHVDKASGKIKQIDVAEKTVITVAANTGTREEGLNDSRRMERVLSDAQVAELVGIGREIERFYGCPQDIEWCLAGEQFSIVQSRPITSLPEPQVPPPTEWKLPRGAYAAVRNNIVELMADPLSPLFATLGLSAVNASLHRTMNDSFAMRGIMPEEIILVVNSYAYNNGSVSAKGLVRIVFNAGKILKMMFSSAVERWTVMGRPRYHQIVESWRARDWRALSSGELLESARHLTEAAVDAYGALVSGVIPAAWITEALFTGLYHRLIKRRGDPSAPTFLLGYPSLPIRADQSLYSLAEWTRHNPALTGYLLQTPADRLATLWIEDRLPETVEPSSWREWVARLREHLGRFGHMIYDLDFAHPVPADQPAPVIDAFKLYLRGQGTDPYARQRRAEDEREQAMIRVRTRIKGWRLKWFDRRLTSAQKYAPLREDGLAEIGLAYPLIRAMFAELGRRFFQRQVIASPDDIYWLTKSDAEQAARQLDAGAAIDSLAERVHRHKAEHQAALRVTPPLALPQMKVFGFDLMSLKKKRGRRSQGDVIQGVAASPGEVTGTARVIHGPQDFSQMQPGDVLVAPITTPAWTPLFVMASAVVTDIGGPLSHGSIVAREYGIPAVLGTGTATRRILSGQTVSVDGSAGTVRLLNAKST